VRSACFALLVAGCGFHTVTSPQLDASDDAALDAGGDSGGASLDLAGVDLTGFDGFVDTCPHPLLLGALEPLNGGTSGSILRFTIGATGLTPCTTLTGGGTLPEHIYATAFVPPDAVAAATTDGPWLVGVDDVVRWSRPAASVFPVDVAPVVDTMGNVQVAIGYWKGFTSQPEVDRVSIVPDAVGMETNQTFTGTVLSFSASPLDPKHLLLLDQIASASDYDPWLNSRSTYVMQEMVNLTTISAAVQFGLTRVVWVDSTSNAVRYSNDSGTGPTFLGPIACNLTCNLVHAVPDPTEPHTFLGLCEHAGTTVRDVVRWSSTGGACSVLFDGTAPGPNTRINRLAVAN
jgi:hypothetical protein